MSYLSQYLEGAHEQVWDDLLAAGDTVFDAPLYQDALAVVQETMRRVRVNLEMLISRLGQCGFVFGYDFLLQQMLPSTSGSILWRDYYDVRRWSQEQPPVFLPAQLDEDCLNELRALGLAEVEEDMLEEEHGAPDMKLNIAQLDQAIGPIPLALRVWYEQVGAVNFFGYHPGWAKYVRFPTHLMSYCDPLQVYVLDSARLNKLLDRHQTRLVKHFEFAPDANFKEHRSGSSTPYSIRWDNGSIDGLLPAGYRSSMTFVKYLRFCFQWAGFPGMATWSEVPADDLALLTQGLIPF